VVQQGLKPGSNLLLVLFNEGGSSLDDQTDLPQGVGEGRREEAIEGGREGGMGGEGWEGGMIPIEGTGKGAFESLAIPGLLLPPHQLAILLVLTRPRQVPMFSRDPWDRRMVPVEGGREGGLVVIVNAGPIKGEVVDCAGIFHVSSWDSSHRSSGSNRSSIGCLSVGVGVAFLGVVQGLEPVTGHAYVGAEEAGKGGPCEREKGRVGEMGG